MKNSISFWTKACFAFYWITILVYCNHPTYAQNLSKITYDINSPLKTNTVYDLYFSSKDLLYIATNNGIWSYDGLEFFQYKHSIEFSSELNNIQENTQGEIFLSDFNGNVYSIDNDSLILVNVPVKEKINNFWIQGKYTYYVGKNTIHIQDNESKKITLVDIPIGVSHIKQISSNGTFYLQQDDGNTYIGQLKDTTLTTLNLKAKYSGFHNEYEKEWCLFDEQKSCLMNIKGDTIVRFDEATKNLDLYRLKKIGGQPIFACKNGLYIPRKNQVFLKGQYVTNVVEDNEQNIWISTTNKGLHKVSDLDNLYYPVNNTETEADLVFVHRDKIIYSDKVGQLYVWNKPNQKFKCFHQSKIKGQLKNIFFDPKKEEYVFSGNQIIFFDKDLNFVGRFSGYGELNLDEQYRFSTTRAHLILLGPWGKSYPDTKVQYVEKEVYKSTKYRCLRSVDSSHLLLNMATDKSNKRIVLWKNYVISTLHDRLLFISIDNYQIEHAVQVSGIQNLYLKNNRLFVPTTDKLIEFDSLGNQLGVVDRVEGLKRRITNLSVNDKYIIVTTKDGVYLLDGKTYEFIYMYTPQNGIVSLDFDKGWVYDNVLYVNGANAISIMQLDERYRKGKVSIGIQKILLNQRSTSKKSFKHNENDLKFVFNIRSYTSSGSLKWRLNGKNWRTNEVGVKYIYLDELQPDAYQMEAYFESDLGVISDKITYSFTIEKPYWQTWWFYALIYLGLGAIIATIVGQRIYNNRKAEQLQSQNNLLRMQALQGQMNPHFIFNIQAAIQGLWLRGNEQDALALQNKFSKLLRKIFQYSGYLSISIEQLLEFIQNYIDLEQIRFKERVDIDLKVDPSLLEEDYFIPPLLVQPIIENSFKHGLLHKENGGKLTISFQLCTDYLYCIIEDNGIGRRTVTDPIFKKDRRASGLKTTQARLELLQQSIIKTNHLYNNIRITDLKDVDNNGIGTRVELWIPFVAFQEAV